MEALRIVHRRIREARDGPVNSPRRLRAGSATYATDMNSPRAVPCTGQFSNGFFFLSLLYGVPFSHLFTELQISAIDL